MSSHTALAFHKCDLHTPFSPCNNHDVVRWCVPYDMIPGSNGSQRLWTKADASRPSGPPPYYKPVIPGPLYSIYFEWLERELTLMIADRHTYTREHPLAIIVS